MVVMDSSILEGEGGLGPIYFLLWCGSTPHRAQDKPQGALRTVIKSQCRRQSSYVYFLNIVVYNYDEHKLYKKLFEPVIRLCAWWGLAMELLNPLDVSFCPQLDLISPGFRFVVRLTQGEPVCSLQTDMMNDLYCMLCISWHPSVRETYVSETNCGCQPHLAWSTRLNMRRDQHEASVSTARNHMEGQTGSSLG